MADPDRRDSAIASSGWLRLCRLEDIPDGDARGFDLRGEGVDTLFIVRRGRVLYGWRNSCPHLPGTPLPWRKHAYLNAGRDRIVCSAHGASFDVTSGVCLTGPCIGDSLDAVMTALHEDGQIFVRA